MSSRVWESTLLGSSIDKAWDVVRPLDFSKLTPGLVRSSVVNGTSADQVGSSRVITYKSGDVWTVKVVELSDLEHKISWETVTAEPAVSFSSRIDTIQLRRVSDSSSTFIEWITDFSTDASISVTEDCKYKKIESFKELQTVLGAPKKVNAPPKWTGEKVRRTYIEYFEKKQGHTFWPSSSVVPRDDPTLLFANSGMNQFKPVFLGQCDPSSPMYNLKRAANSQKCIRAGGKHNDLEDVGKDTYHHTYFEMLGNWSFGDYFKVEAIDWAWDLLVNTYGLDPSRMYATYFKGDEKDGVPADFEARDMWRKYLPADRIIGCGKKDNFWEMGEIGPCGPCTEIHYDRIGGRNCADRVNCEPGDPMVIEIWNLVFMQHNRKIGGGLEKLPAQSVDTGMGFERLTSILQDKTSNYDTDIFEPILNGIQKLSGARPYTGLVGKEDVDHVDMAYRVLADHIRTLTFSITDGAVPGPNGRGYVLRRVLRRAVRYGQQILGAAEGFFHKLVPVVVNHYKNFFPELVPRMQYVMEVIAEEETSFNLTLRKGIKRFNQEAEKLVADGKKSLPGEVAFFLYGTMGFPVDLTELMAEEKGLTLDKEGFERAMEADREMARLANKANYAGRELILEAAQTVALKEMGVVPTDDSAKYITNENPAATVKAIYTGTAFVSSLSGATADAVGIVLDKTSFYGVSGGQVSDIGTITSSNGFSFKVISCQAFAGYLVHAGVVTSGSVTVGESITTNVDYTYRNLITPNHTMTHVLNFALRQVCGTEVDQKGSLVDNEKLRFDFNHKSGLTPEDIAKVEAIVNSQIASALPVHKKVIPLAKAKAINNLRCVFGDTYPDPVRVVAVGKEIDVLSSDPENEGWNALSIEFCGGSHLTNTAQAKAFALVEEGSISKGIRRVVGVTGDLAIECGLAASNLEASFAIARSITNADNLNKELIALREKLNVTVMSVVAKTKLREEMSALERKLIALRKAAQDEEDAKAGDLGASLYVSGSKFVVAAVNLGDNSKALTTAATSLLKSIGEGAVLLGSVDKETGKASLVALVSKSVSSAFKANEWLKTPQSLVGGKGGGSAERAQCQGPEGKNFEAALSDAKAFAAKHFA